MKWELSILYFSFLLPSFFPSSLLPFLPPSFPSFLFSFLSLRQWSKTEESSSLALWFPKKDLEKQVGWTQSCKEINEDINNPTLLYMSVKAFWGWTRGFRCCSVFPLSSTDPWICRCSNTMLAVPLSSSSASFWFRCLSQRSEYDSIFLLLFTINLPQSCQQGKKKQHEDDILHW